MANENTVDKKYGARTVILRPYTLEIGPHKRGPNPTPNKNSDMPRVPTSFPMWNCLPTCGIAGEKLEIHQYIKIYLPEYQTRYHSRT